MTVKEYALGQIHWLLQKDPWGREIFLAAGAQLDQLAERIMAIYNNDNFDALTLAQIRAYEKALGLSSNEAKSLADRRAAIQAAWNVAQKPTLEGMQAICDAWQEGGILVSYEPGTLTLKFIGDVGIPANVDDLKRAVDRAVPAHIVVDYAYRYLLIKEVHEVMTIAELAETPLNSFAGGR